MDSNQHRNDKEFVPYLTPAEGFITGMAAKMLIVAGPVIVFGTLASVLYGVGADAAAIESNWSKALETQGF